MSCRCVRHQSSPFERYGCFRSPDSARVREAAGRRRLAAPQWAVSSRTAVSDGRLPWQYAAPTALRTPRSPATTRGRPRARARNHSAVHRPRPRHAIRQAITSASGWSRSAAKSSVPVATAVASATMYSALRVVNCKARRAMTSTAARRSAARLKTWWEPSVC